ncbi:SAF domain-containing protein [Corynebacterium freiburgense]|uniref:SAF domain-containing protein n=1 Tax=Corynebacterium freiburgense TaxID=556548 RepID=UPI0003F56799|nr:SAF domain-containing protein [Corynebacterium freiburgense]WJZ02090.1 SAF domain protein [Corynebacterium freiburgense]
MKLSLPQLVTPGWRRARDIRRILAFVLLIAAFALTIHSVTDSNSKVLIATQDIPAGTEITAENLSIESVPEILKPEGAFQSSDEIVGRIVVTTIRKKEVITPSRILGSELTSELVSSNTMTSENDPPTMVPVVVADSTIIPLLHHGDTVNIVSQGQGDTEPKVIAAGGRVVSPGISSKGETQKNNTTILIALPQSAAHSVAGASLNSPLTVVITGPRANKSSIRMDQQP